jgi:hypothetical protein
MASEAPRVAFSLTEPSPRQTKYVTEEVDSEASDYKIPASSRDVTAAVEERGAYLIRDVAREGRGK